jgi:hypothetical protein
LLASSSVKSTPISIAASLREVLFACIATPAVAIAASLRLAALCLGCEAHKRGAACLHARALRRPASSRPRASRCTTGPVWLGHGDSAIRLSAEHEPSFSQHRARWGV